MTTEYIIILENLAREKQTFKSNVRKHKLAQLGLMENVGMYMKPILAEQEKMYPKSIIPFLVNMVLK